jgi:hypothetical protein
MPILKKEIHWFGHTSPHCPHRIHFLTSLSSSNAEGGLKNRNRLPKGAHLKNERNDAPINNNIYFRNSRRFLL